MLKRTGTYLFLLIVCLPQISLAQRNSDIGAFAGISYYMGDINPNRHFYRPAPSLGLIYRYNINTRYSLRANAYYADLSGNDRDFPDRPNPDKPMSPPKSNFQTSLMDASLQVEFNFLPFASNEGKWAYTPYITAGITGSMIMGTNTDAVNTISFPFGIGVKVSITSRLGAGAEWGFRKTFSDSIDGVNNPSEVSSLIHNNDWYSVTGIFITYKFFNFATECPAYD